MATATEFQVPKDCDILTTVSDLLTTYNEQKTGKVRVPRTTIAERLQLVSDKGHVLDVTKTTEKGTCATAMKYDEKKHHIRLSTSTNSRLHHAVYDPYSRECVDGVRNFLTQLGESESRISSVLKSVQESLRGHTPVKAKASPRKGARAASPARQTSSETSKKSPKASPSRSTGRRRKQVPNNLLDDDDE